jgi:hypothetical protein
MAERKKKSEVEEKRQNVKQLESEHMHLSALDDPKDAEKGSGARQTAFFAALMLLALAANFIVLLVVSGGR